MGKISTGAIILIIAVVILIGLGLWIWRANEAEKIVSSAQTPTPTLSPVGQAQYYCDQGQIIDAKFYKGSPAPSPTPGQPPVPSGSVSLSLSDGRQMTLPQTISGSGIRYANSSESIVFFSEGNGAELMENNNPAYNGCISVAADPGGLSEVYESSTQGVSIRYPAGYTPNANYQYTELGPGKTINGVSFTIPESMATGTNLGSDTYISVEEIPQAATATCSADLFLAKGSFGTSSPQTITEGNLTYSFASSTGAGVGNRYEEWVYAIPGTSPCVAVRYWIHYSIIGNYPPGTVQQFNQQQLVSQFDKIRSTLTLQQLGID